MKVFLNGAEHELAGVCTLAELVNKLAPIAPYALAVNEQFVAKQNAADVILASGDKIEILSPIQGG